MNQSKKYMHGLVPSRLVGLKLVLAEAGALLPRVEAGIYRDVGAPLPHAPRAGTALFAAFWLTHPADPGGGGRTTAWMMAGGGEKCLLGSGRQSGWLV
jgi:hypothetical protein